VRVEEMVVVCDSSFQTNVVLEVEKIEGSNGARK
jgi:hypothetical protein